LKAKKAFDKSWTHQFNPYLVRPQDIVINDQGDSCDLSQTIGKGWIAVHTPGHSKDHISLILKDNLVFAGDAATNVAQWACTYNVGPYTEDLDRFYEDWLMFDSRYGVKTIFPAHGTPFSIEVLKRNVGRIKNRWKFPRVTTW